MSTVSIRLRSLLPRWMLATDPYGRVNGGPPRKLTKSPVEFKVTGGVYKSRSPCSGRPK